MRPATLIRALVPVVLLATFPFFASAASMKLSPASGSHAVGKTFTVSVIADSGSDAFNSASGGLTFSKEFLSVQSVSKNGSALTLWAVEPSSSNSAGTVSFEGGNTTALTGSRTLLSVTFKALKEGSAKVAVVSGAVLAADGKGTDLLKEKGEATYTITAAEASPPPAPPSGTGGGGGNVNIPLPDTPVVASATHPEENKWYSVKKAKFTWDLPVDVTVVRLVLDKASGTVPTTSYDPAVVEKEYETLEEGIQWFHLRYKNDAGWGPTGHRQIQVDFTPPPEFTVDAVDPKEEGGQVTLKFNATDTLSGVERYEISVDSGVPIKVQPNEVKESGYLLRDQLPGEHAVTVKAIDRAGNGTEAKASFVIPGVLKAAGGKAGEEEEKKTDWTLIWLIGFVSLSTFLVGYIMFEKRNFRREKYVAKRESDEVRDTVGNIFSALREEVGEQTGQLFQRPNPSARDREVMMRINEAIDLSEQLIAKEVEDVRKSLM